MSAGISCSPKTIHVRGTLMKVCGLTFITAVSQHVSRPSTVVAGK